MLTIAAIPLEASVVTPLRESTNSDILFGAVATHSPHAVYSAEMRLNTWCVHECECPLGTTACFSPAHEPLRRHFCAGRPCAQTKDRPNLLASTQDGTAELQGRASSPRPHPTLFQSKAGSAIAPRWREVRSWGFVPYAVSWRAQMLAAFLKRNLLATFPRFLHVKNHLLAHFPQSQAAIVATMQAAFQSHERATEASHQSLSCA